MRVLKFGGSSLSTVDQIRRRAEQVASYHQKGEAVIVVVSAMGSTTNDLARLANSISKKPQRRELDMLLTTGERVSMALMSMALNELGCTAISFTGSQAGILTEQEHNDAYIKEIKPIRVGQELEKGKVVVVAGFQGVDPITKEVTTLGRGGSDTTAIAIAHHFKADHCQILKDVSGVFTADPKFVPEAKVIDHLHFSQLLAMSHAGAKVLHTKAIEMATKLNFPFEIALADDPTQSTKVGHKYQGLKGPLSVNYISNVYSLNLMPIIAANFSSQSDENGSSSPTDYFRKLLISENLTPPQFLQTVGQQTLVYGDSEILHPFLAWIQSKYNFDIGPIKPLVTLTYSNEPSSKELETLHQLTCNPCENIFDELGAKINLSLLSTQQNLKADINTLHSLIK